MWTASHPLSLSTAARALHCFDRFRAPEIRRTSTLRRKSERATKPCSVRLCSRYRIQANYHKRTFSVRSHGEMSVLSPEEGTRYTVGVIPWAVATWIWWKCFQAKFSLFPYSVPCALPTLSTTQRRQFARSLAEYSSDLSR